MATSSPTANSALHIHRDATATPSPALAHAITPSAVATCTRPSTATDVVPPDRVNLQPLRPEWPGPRMQSCLESSAAVFGVPFRAKYAGAATTRRGAPPRRRAPNPESSRDP